MAEILSNFSKSSSGTKIQAKILLFCVLIFNYEKEMKNLACKGNQNGGCKILKISTVFTSILNSAAILNFFS
jgi:hypothetical protein